jgi:hypothetical protein
MATLNSTLTHNATTNIIVGNKNTDDAIIIKYVCVRRMLYDYGEIVISNLASPPVPVLNSYHIDCGFTVTADINGNNIRLNMVVDNSIVDDIDFNYNLEIILK